MTIEERGTEVHTTCIAVHVVGLQDTIAVGVAHRHTERQPVAHRTHSLEVMVGADSSTEEFLLPIGVLIAHLAHHLVVTAVALEDVLNQAAVLITREHVDVLTACGYGDTTVVAHSYLATDALLRGDDNDAIRSTATIDSGSRSILQHGERLDIVRVNRAQNIANTTDTSVIHINTIEDDQRVVGSRE